MVTFELQSGVILNPISVKKKYALIHHRERETEANSECATVLASPLHPGSTRREN